MSSSIEPIITGMDRNTIGRTSRDFNREPLFDFSGTNSYKKNNGANSANDACTACCNLAIDGLCFFPTLVGNCLSYLCKCGGVFD